MNKISQRQARKTEKQLSDLLKAERERHSAWYRTYPGGIEVRALELDATSIAVLLVAQRLGNNILVKLDGNMAHFHAVKP